VAHHGFVVERQMDRGTLASVFSCATVARHWRTGLFLPIGSTTHVLKREIRCYVYCNYGGLGHMTVPEFGKNFSHPLHIAFNANKLRADALKSINKSCSGSMILRPLYGLIGRC
jgi:hypothetical protein